MKNVQVEYAGYLDVKEDESTQEVVIQVTPAQAWAIAKSILFQLEHDADPGAVDKRREEITREIHKRCQGNVVYLPATRRYGCGK